MDGGRVLRALLGLRMDHLRATQIAAGVGQAMALLFGFIGLLTDPWLLFIALFVWIGAEQESSMARIKNSLGGIPVSRAMQTNFETIGWLPAAPNALREKEMLKDTVGSIRKKLEVDIIQTVRGLGYLLTPPTTGT